MPKLGGLVSLDSLVIHVFRRVWGVYLGITSTWRTSCLLERLEHEITWEKKTEVVCYNCQVFWVEVPSWGAWYTWRVRERERTAKKIFKKLTHWVPIVHFDHKRFSSLLPSLTSRDPILPTSLAKSLTSFCKRLFSTSWPGNVARLVVVQGTIRRRHLRFKFVSWLLARDSPMWCSFNTICIRLI